MTTEPDAAPLKWIGWDDLAILKACGTNPQAIRRLLIANKQGTADEPSDWSIYQWTSRAHISSAWRPRLLYAALRADRMELSDAFKVNS